jgi:hypothetical protein
VKGIFNIIVSLSTMHLQALSLNPILRHSKEESLSWRHSWALLQIY